LADWLIAAEATWPAAAGKAVKLTIFDDLDPWERRPRRPTNPLACGTPGDVCARIGLQGVGCCDRETLSIKVQRQQNFKTQRRSNLPSKKNDELEQLVQNLGIAIDKAKARRPAAKPVTERVFRNLGGSLPTSRRRPRGMSDDFGR
jgi:hypothetical protein